LWLVWIRVDTSNFEGTNFQQDTFWSNTNLRNSNLAGATYNEEKFSSDSLIYAQLFTSNLDLSGAWLSDRRCGAASYGGFCTPSITFGYSYNDYIEGKDEIDYILENIENSAKDIAKKGKNWVEDTAGNVKNKVEKYIPALPKVSWPW